jgi:hypothetical protein
MLVQQRSNTHAHCRTHRRLGACTDCKQQFLPAEVLIHPEVVHKSLVVEKVELNLFSSEYFRFPLPIIIPQTSDCNTTIYKRGFNSMLQCAKHISLQGRTVANCLVAGWWSDQVRGTESCCIKCSIAVRFELLGTECYCTQCGYVNIVKTLA